MVRKALFGLGLLLCGSLAIAASKTNLVLITLDSARTDRMGFLGAKGGLTPNLDHLAGESLVFEHAYAQTPGTIVSHATILSGAYPQATGMSEIGGTLPAALPYLPDLLKAQGYRTAAFAGSLQLDPRNGPAQGFDRGFATYDADPGDASVARALAWLARNAQGPFFLWVQIGDPHAVSASYNAAITSADAAAGKLLSALRQQKLYANTAVLVVADHGESLGAHGEASHGVFLYEETIHVPLLLKLPERQPTAKRVAAKVRLVDIAPTMLEIAGIPISPQMLGQSLLRVAKISGGADQPVYSRSDLPERGFGWSALESWRAGKYLYVRAPKPELYDLTADPGATHNLAQAAKATLDTMAAQLESFDRRIGGAKSSGPELSSSEMQKLASLGYVGLQKSAGASAAVAGTDPKDKISTANQVLEAARVLQSKPDRAVSMLSTIVSTEPGMYLAQYTLGAALARKGHYPEAVKHLHKAIELQPDSAWAHYEIGASLVKTADFKTAVVHLEIAAGRLPGFAPAHRALAEAYDHLGRAEDAKRERAQSH